MPPLGPRWIVFIVFGVLWLEAGVASGFGTLVSRESSTGPPIEATRALVAPLDDGRIFQMVEIHFAYSNATNLLWIIPILSDGTVDVTPCQADDLFDQLDALSAPRIALHHRQRGEEGCTCGEGAYSDPEYADIAAHQYSANSEHPEPLAVLPYDNFAELQAFIIERGYLLPSAVVRVLTHYVDHSYTMVMAEVNPDFGTGRVCLELRYRFSVTDPDPRDYDYQLPLLGGSSYTSRETEVLVYTLDEGRAQPYVNSESGLAAFHVLELNLDRLRVLEEGGTNYSELFLDAVTSRDPRAFVTEYSGALSEPLSWTGSPDRWLTRMRTVFRPVDMDQSDLALEVVGADQVSRDYEILVAAADPSLPLAPVWAALALAAAVCLRRRGQRGRVDSR